MKRVTKIARRIEELRTTTALGSATKRKNVRCMCDIVATLAGLLHAWSTSATKKKIEVKT